MPKYRDAVIGTTDGPVGTGDDPTITIERNTSDTRTEAVLLPGGSASYANGRIFSTNSELSFGVNFKSRNTTLDYAPDINSVGSKAVWVQLAAGALYVYGKDTWGVTDWTTWTDPGGELRVLPYGTDPEMRFYSQGTGAVGALFELRGPASSADLSRLKINRSNPTYDNSSVDANCLYSSNIVKAWFVFTSQAGPAATDIDGFGIASYSFPDATTLQINFTNAMSNDRYSVFGSCDGLAWLYVAAQATTFVQIKFRYSDNSGDVNFGVYIRKYSVTIVGKQS